MGNLETIGSTLSITLALLALNPEVQEFICDEIRRVLGDREPVRSLQIFA